MVIAVDRGHFPLVQALLGSGFPVDTTHRIWWTSRSPTHLYSSAVEDSHFENCTALMTASWRGHLAIVAELLSAGANVNVWDSGGRSALSLAVQAGKMGCVRVLMAAETRKSQSKTRLPNEVEGGR